MNNSMQERNSFIRRIAMALSLLIVTICLKKQMIFVYSDSITFIISLFVAIVGYYLILSIAKTLKKKNIHGLTNIAWASFTMFTGLSGGPKDTLVMQIITLIISTLCLYFIIDGFIRMIVTIMIEAKTDNAKKDDVVILESTLAIVASVFGIITSFI